MSGDASSPVAPVSSTAQMPQRRFRLVLSSAIFGVWIVALVLLAATDRPPVILNRLLIHRSPFLVTAQVESLTEGRCRLLKSWRSTSPSEFFIVTNLREVGAQEGMSYLLPLDPTAPLADTTYRITSLPERHLPPAIYPESPDIETQLEAILSEPQLTLP